MRIFLFALLLPIMTCCSESSNPEPWSEALPFHPEDGAHFDGGRDPYYEGWYHKISLPDSNEAFFFIYSVVNPHPETAFPSEAFVYCGRANTLETVYQTFPVEAYQAAREHRDVRIGPDCRATALRIAGRAQDAFGSCFWDIRLDEGVAWPNTMGWLTDAAGLETSWTVGTLSARASGWIEFNGRRFDFENAPAYGDHNWGSVFPRKWFWMQANQFPDRNAALAAAGGTIQFGRIEIEASMIGFSLDGVMHTFRTQDLNAVKVEANKGHWIVDGINQRERIKIQAVCDPDSFFHLLAPTLEGVRPRAWESLKGTVHVTLERRSDAHSGWQTIFQGESTAAGVEWGDDAQ